MTAPRETTTVGVRFPASLLSRVDELAAHAGLTRSGAVLLSVSAGIDPVARAVDAHPANTPQETHR
ncbi:hypothetical protein GMA12_00120 [Kocuria sediminis]|uniref:Ribbon-helix-helix protein CopG domain-containing protein n=2 Tax=Kocuria TaxID=57493 RepID=A0A512IBZ6_9MICC|nr:MULTISPECIES: hypothetical protein [Kocuria]MUN61575.1 hypothetical protein [Kocuria sediminis]GEO95223.1 hypothetical protein KTU01_13460 [Kocuria turfanensis]